MCPGDWTSTKTSRTKHPLQWRFPFNVLKLGQAPFLSVLSVSLKQLASGHWEESELPKETGVLRPFFWCRKKKKKNWSLQSSLWAQLILVWIFKQESGTHLNHPHWLQISVAFSALDSRETDYCVRTAFVRNVSFRSLQENIQTFRMIKMCVSLSFFTWVIGVMYCGVSTCVKLVKRAVRLW